MRLPGLGGWADDPLWGQVYDWTVEHPRIGGALWALAAQSDLRLLYAAASEIGRQRAGARVLDVPSGGGVAVRALRPGQGVDYVAADISRRMLDRTTSVARSVGVLEQVTTRTADVGDLPFEDESFDLTVTLMGLHCFPDPARAVIELARVTRVGGVLTGSTILNDTGLRYEAMRRGGRLAGLLGPGCDSAQLRRWLARQAITDVTLDVSGPVGYFRGVRGGAGPTSPASPARR